MQKCDYREVTGTYTKVAAIAVLDARRAEEYRPFMRTIQTALGRLTASCSLSRLVADSRYHGRSGFRKGILPGGVIRSIGQFKSAIADLLTPIELVEWGDHYVPTLRAWHANLLAAWPTLNARYSETTRLMMEYYLLASAAAFRALPKYWHLSLAKC